MLCRILILVNLTHYPGKLMISSIASMFGGLGGLITGKEIIRQTIQKAKEKKNHILGQYFNRAEAPPQT